MMEIRVHLDMLEIQVNLEQLEKKVTDSIRWYIHHTIHWTHKSRELKTITYLPIVTDRLGSPKNYNIQTFLPQESMEIMAFKALLGLLDWLAKSEILDRQD